ncbi:hypothetical protein FRC09_020137 [Ceratobasidium sp. 395]|nr:hypothetical protein FRC09_020137 [Ceratobasidium sp. 395]
MVVVPADASRDIDAVCGGGALYRTRAGLRRPKINVTRPSSSFSLVHGNEVVGVGGVATTGLGSVGEGRWLLKRNRRVLSLGAGGDEVTVRWGTLVPDAMTSSAKASNPGMGLIRRLVVALVLGVDFCDGRGSERSVRDEHGGNENVPDVHDVVGDTAWIAGEGIGLFDDLVDSDFPDDLPEDDVDAGITDDEDVVELDSLEQEPLLGLEWSSADQARME